MDGGFGQRRDGVDTCLTLPMFQGGSRGEVRLVEGAWSLAPAHAKLRLYFVCSGSW